MSNDEVFDYGEDELQKPDPSKDGLVRLSQLVNEMMDQKVAVAQAEDRLKEAKATLEELSQVIIPELMEDLGQDKCKTSTGIEVSVIPKLRAKISDATRADAIEWLRKNQLDKLLRNTFKLSLNKGEEEKANELRQHLEESGLPFQNKVDVAPQTLGKFIRDRDAEGEKTPDDIFNVYRYREAKIKV